MRLFRLVGSGAVARMTCVAEHSDRLRSRDMPGHHVFLSVLVVDPECQHQGHATRFLRSMLDRLDRETLACYVEITEPTLLGFYER